MLLSHFLFIDQEDVLPFQLLFDVLVDLQTAGLLLDHDLGDLLEEVLGHFPSQHALSGLAGLCDPLYSSVAHLKKFIEVVGEDPQKTKPFYQWYRWVCTFLQHPVVEL